MKCIVSKEMLVYFMDEATFWERTLTDWVIGTQNDENDTRLHHYNLMCILRGI